MLEMSERDGFDRAERFEESSVGLYLQGESCQFVDFKTLLIRQLIAPTFIEQTR